MKICPCCKNEIELKRFYHHYSNRLGFLNENQGVRCRSCNAILSVSQKKITVVLVLFYALLIILLCVLPYELIAHSSFEIIFMALVIAGPALIFRKAPNLLALHIPNNTETLRNDDELYEFHHAPVKEISYNFLGEPFSEPLTDKDWNCKNCKNLNPASFNQCWKCGKIFNE